MDAARFDRLTRALSTASSRRRLLLRWTAAAVGAGMAGHASDLTFAKKKNKQLKRNGFGCVTVGGKCRGKDANCCSGICQGKKPKQGKKDKSRCLAHNTGACTLDSCAVGTGVVCQLGQPNCQCVLTTGAANFCGNFTGGGQLCRSCSRDADCQSEFGPGAACVVLGGFCAAGCVATGGTACVPPTDARRAARAMHHK
jgi:hypothetical protein